MIIPQTLLQNRYLVMNQIGQGGMGTVYIATDQRFSSTVALKETVFTDPALRKAFEREAHLLNRLRHPALPRVSDHFTEGEGQFLVMEFIPGDDLSEMLKRRGSAFPLTDVLDWADGLLDALEYLHTQETPIIHRDIKPQNLKLMSRGQIILLDFGLAKGTPLQMSKVTATGSVFGYSRNYAPLEQIQGTGTDPRSDLYSLGATLYHLMTGSVPPDALTRATAVLNGQPDPLRPADAVHTQVTAMVASVLSSAMAQNAGQRPPTAAAMRAALSDARQQVPLTTKETVLQTPPANTFLSEQETQLLAKPRANTVAPSNVLPSSTAAGLEADSVVTQIKPARSTADVTRPLPGRAIGIAASLLILVVVAAVAVYTLTRQPALETPPSAPTIPQADVSDSQPSDAPPVAAEGQRETSPPAPVALPPATRKANASSARAATRNTEVVPEVKTELDAEVKPAAESERAQTNAQAVAPKNDNVSVNSNQDPMVGSAVPDRAKPAYGNIDHADAQRMAEERRRLMRFRRRLIDEKRRRDQTRRP